MSFMAVVSMDLMRPGPDCETVVESRILKLVHPVFDRSEDAFRVANHAAARANARREIPAYVPGTHHAEEA